MPLSPADGRECAIRPIYQRRPDDTRQELAPGTFAALLGAALAVTMAYGVTPPLLPALVERLSAGGPAGVACHAGWLTGLYTLGLFVWSPARAGRWAGSPPRRIWGRRSAPPPPEACLQFRARCHS